jgi:hypothetical protein
MAPAVRLYTRNALNLTARPPAIAAAAERIKATSFTIDDEAVVLGPDGLSRFDELRRRAAGQTAILYVFDLIEYDGEDLHDRPFLDRKAELALLLRDAKTGILLNEHIAEDGPTVFAHACWLGAEGGTYRSGRARSGSRCAIPRASPCRGRVTRIGMVIFHSSRGLRRAWQCERTLEGRTGFLTRPPLERRALEVSEPETTTTGRGRLGRVRQDGDFAAEHGSSRSGRPDSRFAIGFGLGGHGLG